MIHPPYHEPSLNRIALMPPVDEHPAIEIFVAWGEKVQIFYVGHLRQAYDAPRLQFLTGYTYEVEAIYARCA